MDWKTLIAELRAGGLSQAQIGARLGKSQVWVSDVASGRYADVKWADGVALLALHAEAAKREQAPRPDAPKDPRGDA